MISMDNVKRWISMNKHVVSVVFGAIGAVSLFVPLDKYVGNCKNGIIALSIAMIVCAIISRVILIFLDRKMSRTSYNKGKTKVVLEYADINNILWNSSREKIETLVVPVNTDLDIVFNRDEIKENTIHRLCLDYIVKRRGAELDKNLLYKIEKKRGGFNYCGEKGDWFLLTSQSLGIEDTIQFLFVEIYDIAKKNGAKVNSGLRKEEFLSGIQSTLSAISENIDFETKVYFPLIGAGKGNVGKAKDILRIINALVMFNKDSLRHEIHVVINEKLKKEIPISIY